MSETGEGPIPKEQEVRESPTAATGRWLKDNTVGILKSSAYFVTAAGVGALGAYNLHQGRTVRGAVEVAGAFWLAKRGMNR